MKTDPTLPPNHGQPAAPVVTTPTNYTDGFGIASIIMAAMFFSIPGIILGIIGENKAKNHHASPVLSRIGWIANLIMLIFGLIAAVALAAYLVQNSDEIKQEINNQAVTESTQQTFTAASFTINAPDSFSLKDDDDANAALSISDGNSNLRLVATTNEAGDIADGTTLAEYADAAHKTFNQNADYSEQSREQLASGVIANPHNLEVIDYKIQGNSGITKFVYYIRSIKTANGFYTITTRTTPGQLEANLPTMKRMLASFKETAMSHV